METKVFDLNEVLPALLKTVNKKGTAWEKSFVKSVCEQNERRYLSDKQISIVKRIVRKYDPKVINENNEFQASFNEEMRKDLIYIAKIRKHENRENGTCYFDSMIKEILDNSEFLPTKAQWTSFMENKYSQGYLRAHKNRPKFKKGALVMHCAAAGSVHKSEFTMGIVHDIDHEFPDSYARGAKKYLIIPIGGSKMFTREERELKKCRNPQ